jgi:hypothetical protein
MRRVLDRHPPCRLLLAAQNCPGFANAAQQFFKTSFFSLAKSSDAALENSPSLRFSLTRLTRSP